MQPVCRFELLCFWRKQRCRQREFEKRDSVDDSVTIYISASSCNSGGGKLCGAFAYIFLRLLLSLFQVLFLGYRILSGLCLSVHFNDALLLFSISNCVLKTATADSAGQLISASSTAHLSFWYLFFTLGLFFYACICGYLFLWPKMTSLGWIIV